MEPLGRFPRVLNRVPPVNIEGPQSSPVALRGTFNILLRDSMNTQGNHPRVSIHHDTPMAFPRIFILAYLLDQFLALRAVHAPAPLLRMRRSEERSGAWQRRGGQWWPGDDDLNDGISDLTLGGLI